MVSFILFVYFIAGVVHAAYRSRTNPEKGVLPLTTNLYNLFLWPKVLYDDWKANNAE